MPGVNGLSGWDAAIAASGENYSLAIISRRSAMCFLIRAMLAGQEATPL
jgi:hypothetical protein